MACQGQNCALISVHRRTAGVDFCALHPRGLLALCACVVFSINFFACPFSSATKGQISETAYALHMNSVTPLIASDGAVIHCLARRQEKREGKMGLWG